MTCTCPKCTAEIELDVAAISAEGSFDKCSACSANLEIRKESFARRALYKSTEISCAECGNPPGTSIYCQSCHAVYPEILVIETSSAAKKQLGKLLASLNLLKNHKINTPANSHRDSSSSTSSTGKVKGANLPGQPAQLALILLVLLVIVGAGGYYWYQNKIATEYSGNYVRTLLVIKTARDFEVSISNRVAASWKGGASSTLTAAELKSTASGKTDVDTLMKRLGKIPSKFNACNDSLNKLYDSYGKLHAAVTAPAGSSEIYTSTVKQLDDEFVKSARELKSVLPEKVSARLNESKNKYKALQDF